MASIRKNKLPIILAIICIILLVTLIPFGPLTKRDFVVSLSGGSEKMSMIDDADFGYFFYDPSYGESKESVIKTRRGIILGDSREKVIRKY